MPLDLNEPPQELDENVDDVPVHDFDLNAPVYEFDLNLPVDVDGSVIQIPYLPSSAVTGQGNEQAAARNSAAATTMSQQPSGYRRSVQNRYVKAWKMNEIGVLYGPWQGQHVCITDLEGFRNMSASEEDVAENFPLALHIVQFRSQNTLTSQCIGKPNCLVFRAKQPHELLALMLAKNLVAEIELPYRILLLYVREQVTHLIGVLLDEQLHKELQQVQELLQPGLEHLQQQVDQARTLQDRVQKGKYREKETLEQLLEQELRQGQEQLQQLLPQAQLQAQLIELVQWLWEQQHEMRPKWLQMQQGSSNSAHD